MKSYQEKEYKILDIDIPSLEEKLQSLWAKKVFEGVRTMTHYDKTDRSLRSSDMDVRITEEWTIKLSLDDRSEEGKNDSVKLKISRKKEMEYLFKKLWIIAIAQATSKRISYEREGIDIDIDIFPWIKPFCEIDLWESDVDVSLEDLLTTLSLEDKEKTTWSTKFIYKMSGKDYWEEFAVNS